MLDETIPDYADLMTVQQWNESVSLGFFTPDDGAGHWATDKSMDGSTDSFDEPPSWATHVAWFNK